MHRSVLLQRTTGVARTVGEHHALAFSTMIYSTGLRIGNQVSYAKIAGKAAEAVKKMRPLSSSCKTWPRSLDVRDIRGSKKNDTWVRDGSCQDTKASTYMVS